MSDERPPVPDAQMQEKISRAIAGLGIAAALLTTPPLFTRLFAVSFLLRREILGLWILALVLLAISLVLGLRRSPRRLELAAIFFAALLLLGLELAARFAVVGWMPHAKLRLAQLANRTYPELMAYRGHPFLQFTGNPSVSVIEDRVLGNLTPFNNFGFPGDDFHYAKPAGVLRVAALGGSTTASGYPQMLEDFLSERGAAGVDEFEVMNLGIGWYSSAHSLVNFVMNVVDFTPDYAILHHAWNDHQARNATSGFRGDYAHALKHFHEPEIPDRYLIRASIWYRFLKFRVFHEPGWAFLDNATVRTERPRSQPLWANLEELAPYRRNLTTIMDLAELRGIRAVLTTMPHSSDPTIRNAVYSPHIAQCNTVVRQLAAEYGERILFVDLDAMMSQPMAEVFTDVGHVSDEGRAFKAEQIGLAILADRERRRGL